MSILIGRKFNVGIAKESVRGTALAATYWLPKTGLSIDDKINYAVDDSNLGVIEDSNSQDITSKFSEGQIEGRITDLGFGLLLMNTFGTDTIGAVETGVKDHVFTVLESAQHPSLTFSVVEANSNSGAGYAYALGMIDTLEVNIEIGKYATYKAGFRANLGAALSNSTAYTTENAFRPQDGAFKFASSLAGLSGASAINIKKANIQIKKNIEDDIVIGTVTPADRYNKQFVVEGSVELLYAARTYIDTDMVADLAQAMRLQFTSTTGIGASSFPTLTFDFAKVKLQEVARKIDNNNIVSQTFKFKGYYSLSDALMLKATLRNTVTAAY